MHAYNVLMASVTVSQLPELARPLLLPSEDGHARFSREAFQRMFDAGIFANAARVELLDGEIVMMSPIGPEHVAVISILNEHLAKCLPDTMQCRIQAPVVLSNHSEPEPDLAIVRRRSDNYRTQHPSSEDIYLLIGVAESSRGRDLDWKRRIYAASGIPEYWVVDIDNQVVVVHRELSGGIDYREVVSRDVSGKIAPLVAPNCELDIGWLFP